MMFVAPQEPSRRLFLKGFDVGNTPGQDGQLDFRHVEPTAMFRRTTPLVFSIAPRCQGECGSQKNA